MAMFPLGTGPRAARTVRKGKKRGRKGLEGQARGASKGRGGKKGSTSDGDADPGFADEAKLEQETIERYERALENGYKGQYGEADFIELYKQGKTLSAAHKWGNRDTVPDVMPSTEALADLRKRETFDAYVRQLENSGVATKSSLEKSVTAPAGVDRAKLRKNIRRDHEDAFVA